MGEQTAKQLRELLAAEDRGLGFLAQVPETTVDELERAVRATLDAESEALTNAITEGTAALPVPLRSIAAATLR